MTTARIELRECAATVRVLVAATPLERAMMLAGAEKPGHKSASSTPPSVMATLYQSATARRRLREPDEHTTDYACASKEREAMVRNSLGFASRRGHLVCPFCESGRITILRAGFARCHYCNLPLLGSTLDTLREVVELPDALGSHPCECGHPEMRRLPGGVFHCPACGEEVNPIGESQGT